MFDYLFDRIFAPVFRSSGVGLKTPSGRLLAVPKDGAPTVTFHRWRDMMLIMLSPELRFGTAFAHGHITIINGRIYDVMIRLIGAVEDAPSLKLAAQLHKISSPFLRFFEGRSPQRSKHNVHAHYDLGNDLYRLFLDEDMQYSCAYFRDETNTLAAAQQQKKDHIINKLLLDDGMSVLEIGSGWGGLGLSIAKRGGNYTGMTLSEEQLALAQKRAIEHHKTLPYPCNFELRDYRQQQGKFDRIVSVGMFEHVGKSNFQAFFDQISRNLKDDGCALIHTIGRPTKPTDVNRFITKYIFPGGYIPSLSQITSCVEKTDLLITDVECLYLHYAETLKHWRLQFLKEQEKALKIYGEHFVRIWEFYLAGCEVSFRAKKMLVFQVQLRKKDTAVSLTRDYLYR